MALVPAPIALNVIRMFRGRLDFYYWKGLGVCRKWPRRAQQPNSPAQLAARANFALMFSILKNLPKEWHDSWLDVLLPAGRSVEDLKRKHILWLLKNGAWSEPPAITGTAYNHVPPDTTATLYVSVKQMSDPTAPAKTLWLWKPCALQGDRMAYTDYAPAKTREHYYYWQTKPIIDGYAPCIAQVWDHTRSIWKLTIPPMTSPISIMARPLNPRPE